MDSPPVEERSASLLRETHLRDYWRVVLQHRWTIAAVFLLVVGATAVWTFLQTPIYQAVATVEIQPQARRLAAGQDVSGLGSASLSWYAEEKYHNTQIEVVKSRDVAQRVVKKLQLAQDPEFARSQDPVEAFRKRVQVDSRRDTGLIEVSMKGPDRDRITRWVNAVVHAYVDRNYEQALANVDRALAAIQAQMTRMEEDFQQAEQRRLAELSTKRIYNAENQQAVVTQTLKQYNEELNKIQIELDRVAREREQIRELQRSGGDLMSVPALAGDENLRALITTRLGLERDLESAKVEMKPGHPKYAEVKSQLEATKDRIQENIGRVLGRVENEYALLIGRQRNLNDQITRVEQHSLEVDQASSQYGVYKTASDTRLRVVEVINKSLNEIQLGEQLVNNNVTILDEANPPLFAIKPQKRLNLMVGAMLGLFLGVAAAFFLEYVDNTFRTPEDVERYLGLSVLGVVPRIDEGAPASRAVAEAYQSLRTSVIFSSKNRRRKVLLITSTGPQEGKSSTVANLARTLAAAGDRVLVLDCDLRRPRQHELFAVERDHGLTNYLAAPLERTDWSAFVRTVGPATLQLMASGPIPPSPPELLGSDRFSDLVGALRESYDWVLIDSPPAASLADACLLAALADMSVLVVQYNRTDRDLVGKTLQRLRAVNSTTAGAVLNNVNLERAYSKDYYYAGYYYESDDETSKKKRSGRSGADRKANVG
ncbi:MAG TPA: polysaccharide biosynthesis tyrosine autokinase [Candidatus Polarisedimenticolaceae bacterium]|nr:polysaccharide biosynthesis tyrosine autokinase [Candidatus Polarisedimenticolaceae bacterium]